MEEFKGAKAFLMIPVGIARDKDLLNNTKAILLMGEILSMLNVTGEFFMSNSQLAKRLKTTPRTIKRYLILLEKKGLIKRTNVYADKDQKVVIGRKITVGDHLGTYMSLGWCNQGHQGSDTHFTRVVTPISPKYNNIKEQGNRTNNINNKGSAKKAEPDDIPYQEILDYLNSKTKAHYKATSKVNQRLIKARFKEGYTKEDFKTVIDNKAYEWQHSDMWKYMRPSTLFGSKFDDYLNENKLKKSVGTVYRNNNKRVEKGTDWSKKKTDTQSGISTEDLKNLFQNLDN